MRFRHCLPLAALLGALLLPGSAQARVCPATSSSSLEVHGVTCAHAVRVLNAASPHIAAGDHHFPVFVGGRRWGCDETAIAGHPTLTCEHGYGTPERQFIIFVSR